MMGKLTGEKYFRCFQSTVFRLLSKTTILPVILYIYRGMKLGLSH